MLVDVASVIFSGGHGGAGIISFGKKARSGPDGGNGGAGGNLFVKAANDITLLNQFREETKFSAEDGLPGKKQKKTGKAGKDLVTLLPLGTSIFEEESGLLIAELTKVGQELLLCKGGLGGRGNFEFRSAKRTTPEYAQPGLKGERKGVRLVLKLIADFGLIGLPNSGKSSLLNELTNAKAKIGNYAFTTLSPNLGIAGGKVFADIPGLIAGASAGKGLGISFLKHIEKVGTLLHCITSESANHTRDYETVRGELGNYNLELLRKPEVILVTKSDLVEKKELKRMMKDLSKKNKSILATSIHDWDSLERLKGKLGI